ncbi:cupin domain-containing protein [Leptolyngbya sp. AN02str]|uniref:cupin domain-containing protein n=1 Tax=Leptolyngbya sp. AN02str TaxID=3423363 RepID=UPI003D31F11C
MSLVNQISVLPLRCIQPADGIEICPVDSVGVTEYRIPSSHETNLVHIAPNTVENLFVHHFQTDQLLVVKGKLVLVILQNGRYEYVLMSDRTPSVIIIPPGIPHGAANLTDQPCIAINSVIRHGTPHPWDYRPVKLPMPYDLDTIHKLLL